MTGLTIITERFGGIEFGRQSFFSTPAGGHASNFSLGHGPEGFPGMKRNFFNDIAFKPGRAGKNGCLRGCVHR
jgi:hypothetical protein